MSEEKKKTILVIDDEPDTRVYISSLLEDNGYDILTAENGEEASTVVEKNTPDLITLDITMPEKSGVRFYRDMKENDAMKHIPIIMVTGISKDFETFISTRRQVPPPEGFLPKPIDREALLDTISKLLK